MIGTSIEPTVGNARAALSALLGLLSVVLLPVAVLATRYIEQYRLVQAGFAIPVAFGLALAALSLARSAKGYDAIRLGRAGGGGAMRAGRILAWTGIWLAGAATVSLAVWGGLEYWATR
jgi:hypothetical protein